MGMYKRMNRQQRRFFRHSLILLIVVSSLTLLTGYLGSFPTAGEFKALGKAAVMPEAEGSFVANNKEFNFPLPPNSSLLEDKTEYKKYLTLSAGEELRSYYYERLPENGWAFVDQLGSGYFFTNGEVKLTSTRRGLARGIEVLTFSIKQQP